MVRARINSFSGNGRQSVHEEQVLRGLDPGVVVCVHLTKPSSAADCRRKGKDKYLEHFSTPPAARVITFVLKSAVFAGMCDFRFEHVVGASIIHKSTNRTRARNRMARTFPLSRSSFLHPRCRPPLLRRPYTVADISSG